MENNLSRMDQDVKGIKHLRKSILTLKDNLLANGYEMPELLGKQFHQAKHCSLQINCIVYKKIKI